METRSIPEELAPLVPSIKKAENTEFYFPAHTGCVLQGMPSQCASSVNIGYVLLSVTMSDGICPCIQVHADLWICLSTDTIVFSLNFHLSFCLESHNSHCYQSLDHNSSVIAGVVYGGPSLCCTVLLTHDYMEGQDSCNNLNGWG